MILQEANQDKWMRDKSYEPSLDTTSLNTSTSYDSDAELEEEGFKIMNRNADNQLLLIKLKSSSVVWHRGQVLFSNQSIPASSLEIFSKNPYFGNPLGTRDLCNMSPHIKYYTLSKCDPYTGKILILSQPIYKESFYIDPSYLLTVNYNCSEYTTKTHPELSHLKQIVPRKTIAPLFVSLQGRRDSPIVEKYLDVKESLYLPNASILAISESVHWKWDRKFKMLKFSGPGFIFFEPQTKSYLNIKNREFVLANIFLIILIAVLYCIEYIFLT